MNMIKNCNVIIKEELRFEAHNNINFILKCEFCGRIYRGKYSEPTLIKHIITVHKEQKFLTVHKESKFLRIREESSNNKVVNVLESTCKTPTNDKTKEKFPKKKTIYDYYSISPSHIISYTPNRTETLRQNAKLRIFQKQLDVENVEGQKMKSFLNKSNVKIGDSKKYNCPHCGLESITNANIRKHIKEVHERKKYFTCGNCEKSFSRKFNLKKHQEHVHTI